ncbi:SsgA family sporulation/cell division regulator [Sciscionella sediminilitoris]|uniref:SsgA family sporulation/cell division regulator n=1 Tax=Sciscionella sediminilitoris TaxID=1445613 RepID=UPI00068E86BF|nr:SsgA family sporulation/cell division regulator [Sciscionella sp. SE31]
MITGTALFGMSFPDGTSLPIVVDLAYYERDPWAIHLEFRAAGGRVAWRFDRELLAAGLCEPSGEGDVSIQPLADEMMVVLGMASPEGEARFLADTRELTSFVEQTYALADAERAQAIVDEEFDRYRWPRPIH